MSKNARDAGVAARELKEGVSQPLFQDGQDKPKAEGCGWGSGIFFLLFFVLVLWLMMRDSVLKKH